MRKALIPALLAAVMALLSASFAVAAPIVENGSFETGDLTGWGLSDRGNGTWEVYDDPSEVDGGIDPPHGTFAIITQQGGPGSHVLHQRVRLPGRGQLRLKFVLWYDSSARLVSNDSLSHRGQDNQQFRMDILKPGATLRTLNPDAILATIFRTRTGGDRERGPLAIQQRHH
jgi:hypothetical protein